LLVLLLAAFVAGGVFAQEGPISSIGGGLLFDASRSEQTDHGLFWSHLYAAPWGFVDIGSFELSLGVGIGRIARQSQWCFLLSVINVSLLWRIPDTSDILDDLSIVLFTGIAFDAVYWARHACLRSDATLDILPGHPIREFSSLKIKLGFGRDFEFSGERFFRAQLLLSYGLRLSNPNPFGGTIRLGFGRHL